MKKEAHSGTAARRLQGVSVVDLKCGTNAGVCLEGRLRGNPPTQLEDVQGTRIAVRFPTPPSLPFREGDFVVVKEPTVDEGEVTIDGDANVVAGDEAEAAKARGNELFQRGFVTEAAALYTKGIEAASRSAGQLGPLLCN
eukprot:Polyplicarium_translucidae@DN3344_c0_g1_i13.p3